MPPWISFVARIVIWVGSAAHPEAVKAATQLITASILEVRVISRYERVWATFGGDSVPDNNVCSKVTLMKPGMRGVPRAAGKAADDIIIAWEASARRRPWTASE